ncbi:hypothetical protein Taro_043378 [Colocasia esculenta]|uniref:Uncharacterized protein n=1 Tax=Colocasia esculenta TaxID=4460 RepID=A0A843WKY2_COLES|nr:hypothetical protein [Colocasia esculenta]
MSVRADRVKISKNEEEAPRTPSPHEILSSLASSPRPTTFGNELGIKISKNEEEAPRTPSPHEILSSLASSPRPTTFGNELGSAKRRLAPRPDEALVIGLGLQNSGSFLIMGRISEGSLPKRGRSLTRRDSSGRQSRSESRRFSDSRHLSPCDGSSLLGFFTASAPVDSCLDGRLSLPAAPRVDSSLTYFFILERRSERLTCGFFAMEATNTASEHTLVRMLTAVLRSISITFITSIWNRLA